MKELSKKVSLNNPKRTRFKIASTTMITCILCLIGLGTLAWDQYNEMGDIGPGVGSVIGGVLVLMGGVVQIYSRYETARSSNDTIVQIGSEQNASTGLLPADFEDEGDDIPTP